MEEELANDNAVARQVALETANVLEALLPDVLSDELGWEHLLLEKFRVDAHDERFLVVAAIEDPNAPALRHIPHATPQEIVIEFFRRWRLEGIHLAALRVEAGHDVLDGAVLPAGIHGLKDQQHRPAVLRVEHILQLGQRLDAHGERFLGTRLILGSELERVAGIDVFEAKAVTVRHSEGFREASAPLDDVLRIHENVSFLVLSNHQSTPIA